MVKKIINRVFITIGFLIFLLVGFLFVKKSSQSSIVYYYGADCPHCLEVEKFLKENKIEEKLTFEKKEVYYNQKNAQELSKRAKKCGLKATEIPVPFIWDGSKCIIGDEAVINFFKEKIKK